MSTATATPNRNNKLRVLVVLVALALLGAVIYVVARPNDAGADTDDAKDNNDKSALIELLTVKESKVDCVELVSATGGNTRAYDNKTVVAPNIGALKGTPPRKWSDALSTPLKGKSPPSKFRQLQSAICQDPLLGVTTANMLAGLTVDGVRVVDQNDWLKPYTADAGQINDKAAGFVLMSNIDPDSDEQVDKAVKANLDYQDLAGKLNTLLKRFHLDGVKALQSTKNWHLAGGGLAVGGLPEVALNKHQENLPALVLSVRLKDVCVPAKLIGFNTGDKRPEVFETKPCGHKPPTTSTCKDRGDCPTDSTCRKDCEPDEPTCRTNCEPGGKDHNDAGPRDDGGNVVQCDPGEYLPRGGDSKDDCKPDPTPSPDGSGDGSGSDGGGKGDSGPGATNTTAPPPTSAPEEPNPSPSAPTVIPVKP